MDKLFSTLTLGTIFRHFVSGGIFVLTFIYCRYGLNGATIQKAEKYPLAIAFVSLVVGSLIYAIHRSTLMVLVELARHRHAQECDMGCYMKDEIRKNMFNRWVFSKNQKSAGQHIFDWGDYVHFLFTSAIAIFIGSMLARWTDPDPKACYEFSYLLAFAVLGLLLAGWITDCRKYAVELDLYENDCDNDLVRRLAVKTEQADGAPKKLRDESNGD